MCYCVGFIFFIYYCLPQVILGSPIKEAVKPNHTRQRSANALCSQVVV